MKKLSWIVILIAGCCVGCGKGATEKTDTKEPETKPLAAAELPAQFYKKLKGTIGDGLKVTMDLFREDSVLQGHYYYDNIGTPIDIDGTIAQDGTITLEERNMEYVLTGTFTLSILSPDEFEGTWVKPESQNTLPVALKAATEGVTAITMETFFEENCKMRYIDFPEETEELRESWTDTLCPYKRVNLLSVHTVSADVDQRINSSIVKAICDDTEYKTVQEYVHSVQAIKEPGYEGIGHYCRLTTNDNGILCVSIWQSWDGGGAHPLSSVSHYNFDLSTGNAIMLPDVVDPKFMQELEKYGEQVFNETYGTRMFESEDGFHLGHNFAMTTEGLMFSFEQYEMGPYVIGTADIVLRYKDIQDMLVKNGPASRFPVH